QRVLTTEAQGNGEVEVIASTNGQTIVIARQGSFRISVDGGQNFLLPGLLPFPNFGDSSLAFGQSGNFYLAGVNNTMGCNTGTPAGCATGIARSMNNGLPTMTFQFVANAIMCPFMPPNQCFPDQEHIAADRVNAGAGGDRVYSVWRNFGPGAA